MTCRAGLLCLLVVIATAGCKRKDGPPTSAQAGDVVPPRPPNAQPTDVLNPVAIAEFKKFEGTWVVTEAKLDGEDLSAQVGQEFIFAAGKVTVRNEGRVLDTAKVILNPSANPKAIDLVSDNLQAGEQPARFIYEFDAEVLRLCRGDIARPTSFVGKEQVVFTLKRKKG